MVIFLKFKLIATLSINFTGYDGRDVVVNDPVQYLIGLPDCGKMQMWSVYHDPQVNLWLLISFFFVINKVLRSLFYRTTITYSYFLMENLDIILNIADRMTKMMITTMKQKKSKLFVL